MRKNLKSDILSTCSGWEREHIVKTLNEIVQEIKAPSREITIFDILEDLYGVDYQYALNSEEVFELIESLTRYGKLTARNQRPDRRQDNQAIISEMADVIICIYQLLYTRKVSPNVLDTVMKEKIQRTCNNESVRTAIAELSRKVIRMTTISSAPTVDGGSTLTK